MLKRSMLLALGAVAMATAPLVLQAQEYLPPVIDRSGGSQESVAKESASTRNLPINERVLRLERLLDNQALVDMSMNLEALQADSQALRGEIESLTHNIEALKQRQHDLYLDVDRRLRQVELGATQSSGGGFPAGGSASAIPSVGSLPAAGIAAAGISSAAAADPAQERQAYQKAFNALKEGQYDQAITEFQGFLTLYPAGEYTDNAQYWLGEANYVTRRFKVAEQEFRKVLDRHPDSSKASDAMLKLGYTYYELGEWASARKTLNDVVTRFANSTAARLAQNRLQKMRLEGR